MIHCKDALLHLHSRRIPKRDTGQRPKFNPLFLHITRQIGIQVFIVVKAWYIEF